jgi:septum formation protein
MPAEFILASGSPRRRELLEKLGASFEVVTADVEEVMDPAKINVKAMAGHNAALKARAVAKLHPNRWASRRQLRPRATISPR